VGQLVLLVQAQGLQHKGAAGLGTCACGEGHRCQQAWARVLVHVCVDSLWLVLVQ
jgi:hypothetical protein